MSSFTFNYPPLASQQHTTLSAFQFNDTAQYKQKGPFKFEKIKAYANMPSYRKAGSQWNDQQILKFAIFVVVFYNELQKMQNQNTQKWRMFKKMSRFIKGRNPNQCRSYLMKIVNKFGTLRNAIIFYEANIKDLGYLIQRNKFQLIRIQEQQANQSNYSSLNLLMAKRESIKSHNIILSEPKYSQKTQKQDNQPTASSYYEQQNLTVQKPVNHYKVNHYTNQNSFSDKNIYFFSKNYIKKQRKSIPSFQSFQDESNLDNTYQDIYTQKQVKIEQKNSQNSLNLSNPIIQQQFLIPSMNIQKFINSFSKRISYPLQKQQPSESENQIKNDSSEQILQKRRQAFQQCQKYFLLWINKLWKIMEQFPQQREKNPTK